MQLPEILPLSIEKMEDPAGSLEHLPTGDMISLASDSYEMARVSPDFLCALAMPEISEYRWPPVFVATWMKLREYVDVSKRRVFARFALGLPRGFGKTTVIKLFALYCVLFTNKQFILVLSETATKANNIISDIVDMLDEPNIVAVFGNWRNTIETDTQALKKFSFRGRNIIIAGLGCGGSVRGLNLKNVRPDVIIMDDIQSREDADSEMVSEGIYKWMLGTALKAKSPKGCLALFIANMYPTPHSILKKLIRNSKWDKLVAGGILQKANGDLQSLWEDLQPLEQLLDEYAADLESGHPEIFHAEVLNDPDASVNNSIDLSRIPELPFDDTEQELHQGSFVMIDPASGKVKGDNVEVGYFQIHDNKSVLWDVEGGKFSPATTIHKALLFCQRYNCRCIVVEGVAYQSTLVFWFNYFLNKYGFKGITVLEIYPGRQSKNSRILNMFKELTGGEKGGEVEIYLHPRIRTQVVHEISGFNPLKTDNVDNKLDLLTYASRIKVEFSAYLASHGIIEMQDDDSREVVTDAAVNSSF